LRPPFDDHAIRNDASCGPTQKLGLPAGIRACLFDLDGVLTPTALVHAKAWKRTFDAYLRERAGRTGEPFEPFDSAADYERYVDGKPRYDGVRSFLASRGIELPEGTSADPPGAETVCGLGNRKDELVVDLLRRASSRTRARCGTCEPSVTRVSTARSSRRAPTVARCSRRPASRICARYGSTGSWQRSGG
jgi:beta-phosphoglucomutase-like phosphatase (HAD superfamily)